MLDRILGDYDAIEREVENDCSVFEEIVQCPTDADLQLVDVDKTTDDDDGKQSNI